MLTAKANSKEYKVYTQKNLSLSTSEHDTGRTFLDGEKIYAKTLIYSGDGKTTNNSVSLDTGLATSAIDLMWIDVQNSFIGLATRGAVSGFMMPNHSSNWFGASTMIQSKNNKYIITMGSNQNTPLGYCAITINYTKK